jgi:WD40 repeat protein
MSNIRHAKSCIRNDHVITNRTSQFKIAASKVEGRVLSVAFTPDSSRFVSGGFHGSIKLWDVQGLSLIRKYNYEGHQGSISVMHC